MARNTEKCEKWQIYTVILDYAEKTERSEKWDTNIVRPGKWRKKKKTDKVRKWETQRVGPGIWQETMKNVQNEKHTL